TGSSRSRRTIAATRCTRSPQRTGHHGADGAGHPGGFDLAALPVDSADSLHLQIEAVKLAFADVYEHVSDADTMRVRSADLLDKEYLRSRGRLIDMKKAKTPQHGVPGRGGTVYLTAADASGMMISYIQSNYQGLGSGVVVDGISMQNRGYSFVLRPDHP